MSGSRATQHSPAVHWLVIAALAMTVAGVAVGIRLGRPWAAEESKPATAEEAKPAAAAPKPQTPAEADVALEQLMKARPGGQDATVRGRSLADAPKFVVIPRKEKLAKYPCTKCHDNSFVDRRVRPMVEDHRDLVFDHGGGRFWCYEACHSGRNIDSLVSLRGRPIDYDASYKVCGQCHSQREKDWHFGGHGKRSGAWNAARDIPLKAAELLVIERERIGTWRDERVLLNCTACHNPHSPSIKSFKPSPPPGLRPGVSRGSLTRHPEPKVWDRHGAERKAR